MNKLLVKLSHMILHLAEVKTDNGVLISDSEIEVGREVFIENTEGELIAAPDGEYKAEDGKIFVVADGKVAEIREPEADEQEPEQPIEEEQEEQEPEQPAEEETPAEDDKDKRIAELEAQIAELNNVIVEKDNLIGELRKELEEKTSEAEQLKAELESSDSKPAEELLKSQKTENKSWFKPRF
jgi:protein required for attachment to host cells